MKVAILLATFNGERYINALLESIKCQDYANWELYVSDNESSDDTLKILEEFKRENPNKKIEIFLNDKKKGFPQNFFYLLLDQDIDADLYAFCDQDDIWMEDKISRAVNWFEVQKNVYQSNDCLNSFNENYKLNMNRKLNVCDVNCNLNADCKLNTCGANCNLDDDCKLNTRDVKLILDCNLNADCKDCGICSSGSDILESNHCIPLVYCSSTKLIDESGKIIGMSTLFKKKSSFKNAIYQNIVHGNTAVFNREAYLVLRRAGWVDVKSHDWWLYFAITACGGLVFYDSNPTLLYRQHENNTFGSKSRINAYKNAMKNENYKRESFYSKIKQNIVALKNIEGEILNDKNYEIINFFKNITNYNRVHRIIKAVTLGLYRQRLFETLYILTII